MFEAHLNRCQTLSYTGQKAVQRDIRSIFEVALHQKHPELLKQEHEDLIVKTSDGRIGFSASKLCRRHNKRNTPL